MLVEMPSKQELDDVLDATYDEADWLKGAEERLSEDASSMN